MNARQWLRCLRRGTLILSAVAVLWIVSRFRAYPLPADPEVLPVRFDPGQTLLIDLRPRGPAIGDAWLVRTSAGTLALGIVQAVSNETMALTFGRQIGDSTGWIWVPKASGEARVLLSLPF